MVLSGSKRTSSIDSIVNLPQGGGPNKAGLPPSVAKDHWYSIYMDSRGTSRTLFGAPRGLRYTVNPCVSQSRPVGVRPGSNTYWTIGGSPKNSGCGSGSSSSSSSSSMSMSSYSTSYHS